MNTYRTRQYRTQQYNTVECDNYGWTMDRFGSSDYSGLFECGAVSSKLIGLHGLPLLSTIAPADNSGSDSSSTFGV